MIEETRDEWLIGIRLRDSASADDYKLVDDVSPSVGDIVMVETTTGTALGEVRRPRRPLPDFRRDRLYRRVVRAATTVEEREYRDRRQREERAVASAQKLAPPRPLPIKVVDVEMPGADRRVTVYFNAEDRIDFRDLVRDLAREFRARIEMRQIGARDTTRVMDGIGPCGRQLCCSSHLRKFEPISVKMAKTQDMPLTDSRLLGNCGRLKCCLLYEFSTYQELRARLPRVNTACQADCGGGPGGEGHGQRPHDVPRRDRLPDGRPQGRADRRGQPGTPGRRAKQAAQGGRARPRAPRGRRALRSPGLRAGAQDRGVPDPRDD